jgi:hypothetical protein
LVMVMVMVIVRVGRNLDMPDSELQPATKNAWIPAGVESTSFDGVNVCLARWPGVATIC